MPFLSISFKTITSSSIYYSMFVLVYGVLLVVYPVPLEAGYDSLWETVLAGEAKFPAGFYPSIGRFYPLAGFDYNFLLNITDSFFAFTL